MTTAQYSPVSAVILIDNRIESYQTVVDSVKNDVRCVVYDVNVVKTVCEEQSITQYQYILNKVNELQISSFTNIGIIQHNMNSPTHQFFSNNADEYLTVELIEQNDPAIHQWAGFSNFIISLKTTYGIQNVDLMACALYSNPNWKYIIDKLALQTGTVFRASTDDTGSATLGGNWFLESHNGVNLKTVYFTDRIDSYTHLLTMGAYAMYSNNKSIEIITTPSTMAVWGNNIASTALDATLSAKLVNITKVYSARRGTTQGYLFAIDTSGVFYAISNGTFNSISSNVFNNQSATGHYDCFITMDSGYISLIQTNGNVVFITNDGGTYPYVSIINNAVNPIAAYNLGAYNADTNRRFAVLDSSSQLKIYTGDRQSVNTSFWYTGITYTNVARVVYGRAKMECFLKRDRTVGAEDSASFPSAGGWTNIMHLIPVTHSYMGAPIFGIDSSNNLKYTAVYSGYDYNGIGMENFPVAVRTNVAALRVTGRNGYGIALMLQLNGNVSCISKVNIGSSHRYTSQNDQAVNIYTSIGGGLDQPVIEASLRYDGLLTTRGDSGINTLANVHDVAVGIEVLAVLLKNGNVAIYRGSFTTIVNTNNAVALYVYGENEINIILNNGSLIRYYNGSITYDTSIVRYNGNLSQSSTILNSNVSGAIATTGLQAAVIGLAAGTSVTTSHLSTFNNMDLFNYFMSRNNRRMYNFNSLNGTYTISDYRTLTILNPFLPTDKSYKLIVPDYQSTSDLVTTPYTTTNVTISASVDNFIVAIEDGEQFTINGNTATTYVLHFPYLYSVAISPSFLLTKHTSLTIGSKEFTIYGDGGFSGVALPVPEPPTLSNFSIPVKTVGDASFNLTAPTSNNNPATFTYSVPEGNSVATISGSSVSIIGAGSVVVTATQSASGGYLSGSITATLTVNNPAPTYQSISQVSKTFGVDASFSLAAVMAGISNSDGAYTFSSSSAAVSVAGTVATINAYTPSAVTITVSQDASGNYASGSTTFSVLVNRGTPTYQAISQVSKTFGVDASFSLAAVIAGISNSNGAYTFSSSSAAVSVAGTVATINAYTPSAITITASQDASGNYAASSTTFTVLVNRGTPTYQAISQVTKTVGADASFSLSAVMAGISNSSGAYTFTLIGTTVLSTNNMNTITGGGVFGGQYQSNLKVSAGANLIGWDEGGTGTVHTVDISNVVGQTNTPNYVIMIWQDNVITQTTAVSASNTNGAVYTVSFKAGPAVYQIASQATQATANDGIIFEVLRSNNSVLATSTYYPGAWAGYPTLTNSSFNYTGDGTGNVRIRIRAVSTTNIRFAGCVDDVVITTPSGTLPTELSISGDVATVNAYTTSAITVSAAQDASGNYASGSTTFSVLVNRGAPTYQAISQVTKTVGVDASFSLAAVMAGISNSNGAYTFASSSAAVSVAGDVATINAYTPSAITITASQDASGNYTSGSTTFSVLVNRGTPTYQAISQVSKTFGVDASFSLAAVMAGISNSNGAYTFTLIGSSLLSTNNMNNITNQNFGSRQYQSNLKLSYGGNLDGWNKVSSNSVHIVDISNTVGQTNTPNYVLMVFNDSLITQSTAVSNSNINGVVYTVRFKAGPAVWESANQATQATVNDGIIFELLRSNDTVLATSTYYPGAWAGYPTLTDSSFNYTGDGTGNVRLRIKPVSTTNNRFAGCVDDVMLISNSGSSVVGSTPNELSINGNVATINAYTPSAVTISASQAESGDYIAGSTTFTVLVNRKTPSYGAFSVPAATYGDASFSIAAYAPTTDSTTAPFTYTSSDPAVATINSDGTIVTVIGQGYTTITASQDASGNYAAGSTTTSFLVNRAAPTFLRAFTIPDKTFGVDASFALLPLTDGLDNTDGTYTFTSSNSEIVAISEDGLTANILGYTTVTPVTIYVAIDACGNYASASTSGTVSISRGMPTYQSISQVVKSFGDAAFSLTSIMAGVSDSSGAYTFTSSDASAVSIGGVNGDTATILAYTPSAITITASQAASVNYGASSTTFSVLVNRKTPTLGTLSLGSLNGYYDVSDEFFPLTAPTSDSSGSFVYSSSNTNAAVISDASFSVNNLIARYDPSSLSNMTVSSGNITSLHNLYGSSGYNLIPIDLPQPKVVTYNSKTMINGAGYLGLYRNVPLTQNLTIIIFIRYNPNQFTLNNYATIFQHGNRDGDVSIVKKPNTSDTFSFVSNYDYNIDLQLVPNRSYILVGRIRGSTRDFYAYSETGTVTSNTGNGVSINAMAGSQLLYIGSMNASSHSYFGEIFYYNAGISDDKLNATVEYLKNKWFNTATSTKYVRFISSGNTTITATQDICGNYGQGSSSSLLRVGATVPTFGVFTVSATSKTYGDAPFTLTPPTSDSDGIFTFTSSNSNVISIVGTTATIVGGGNVTITVSQDPSGSFTRKTVSAEFTVLQKSPNLRNFSIASRPFSQNQTFEITPPESDNLTGLLFRYTISSGSAVIINNEYAPYLMIFGGGTATVAATQYGNANYFTETITTTVTITPGVPVNSYSDFSRQFHLGTIEIPRPTSSNSGSIFTYTSSDTSVATIDGSNAIIHKVGSTVITANIAGNIAYLVSDISAVMTVTKGTPTMSGSGLSNTTISMTSSPYVPIATSTSNGTFTYVSDNSGVVLITNNNTVSPVSVGTANITATIGEDTSGNYNSRSVSYTISVIRGTSNLSSATFTVPNAITYGDTPASLVVAPVSNNTAVPIVYSSANTNIATIDSSSGVITARGAGTVYFIASQAQTAIYAANSRNSGNMIVNRKTVTQTKNAPYTENTILKYYGDSSFTLSTTSESTASKSYTSSVAGIVTISNSSGVATVSITNVGTTTITGIQSANSQFSTQNDVAWTLTVEKGTTALTGLPATLTKNVSDVPFVVSATSNSLGTKSYALANPADTSVLTVNSTTGLVTLRGPGTATVVISQLATSLYNAPASVSCVITVNEAGTALQGATIGSDRVFSNVDMTGASFTNSTITSVSFSGATLANAVMSNSTVRNASMTSATMSGVSLVSSDISGTDFTSATLTSANMANTVLTNSIMTNAVLTGAAMTNATITRTTFTGANVRSANLTGATMTDSTLTSTDLSGSILRSANVSGSTFVGAVLANADLSGAVVTNANFTNANIRGANITNVAFSPLQKLQLLKNTNNRDIGGVQVSDVSGSVLLSAISGSSPAATIPNISNSTIKVVIPTTSTNVGDTIPNVTLDTTTSDKFYFPINTDEYFQIEGVKYYVSDGVIKRQSDDVTVSVISYGNRRIWLIAGSVIASVLELNTISSSTFTIPSYKLDTDPPFNITVAPTSNSPAPIVYSSNNPSVATIHPTTGLITIHKQGYVSFIASQEATNLYEDGSKTSNELFVNKLINFTLTGLNQTILMSTLGALDASAVSLEETDAVAVFYVKQSDMMDVFKFQSDSNDMNEDAASDVKYYVFDRNWPAQLKINPLHAMMNKTESVNMLGNAETFTENKMLVKHDFIRYLSLKLFNTIHGVDLFSNESDLLENAVYGGETIRDTIHGLLANVSTTSSSESMSYDVSGNKYLTNDVSGNTNLCRELLRQMVAGAPGRFGSITDANTPQSLPFQPDDTINFKVTLQAAPTQNLLTGVSEIPVRSYLVKLVIKSTLNGGNVNTVVTDSEMYPNAYPYSSSVVSYAPTSASSAVYNSYSPPAPIPFSRFGFNGWYYTNSTAWVNVAPAVRNHTKWLVPANNVSSSTVGGLQYVRVNLKIHNKTSLPYVSVYTQSGSYRKYAVSGGSNSLTNGTKYTFYMNFNSYTREPAVVGYTNAALINGIGAGNFNNNEVISSITVETDSNAAAGSVEFTMAGVIVGDIVSGVAVEKEYGFLADVPVASP